MTQPPNGWQPPHGGWQPPPGQQPPSWGPVHQPYPGPPPKKGGALKWILGGVALLAIIAVTAVVSVSLSKRGNDGAAADTASDSNSEFASANDTGPVTIITEDPTCAASAPIQNTLHDSEDNGWLERDPSIPASAWSPEQRAQHQSVGQAMRGAADQIEPLVALTPHRVVRQLYEQFIAYSRAYADKIPTYTPPDDDLARTGSTVISLIGNICTAIAQGSAAARAVLVSPGAAPEHVAEIGDPANPKPFIANSDPVCTDWIAAADRFNADTAVWRKIPPDIPAGRWSSEQKDTSEAVVPVLLQSADTAVQLGQRSDNPTLQDVAALAAQYFRAFAQALPTYTPTDTHLYDAARRGLAVVRTACDAARTS